MYKAQVSTHLILYLRKRNKMHIIMIGIRVKMTQCFKINDDEPNEKIMRV